MYLHILICKLGLSPIKGLILIAKTITSKVKAGYNTAVNAVAAVITPNFAPALAA